MESSASTHEPLFELDDARSFLRRVRVRNYKSIGQCSADLGSLTILVGRNGAGKSNFLDAIRFVSDSLQTSLDHAIRFRGGIDSVRRRSTGHPRNFHIELQWILPGFQRATFEFEIGAKPRGGFVVRREALRVTNQARETVARYTVIDGEVQNGKQDLLPVASPDRLYLVAASNLPAFRPVYDAITSMGFYNLNPDAMKEPQSPDAGELLHRDGSNIASVIARLSANQETLVVRIKEFLEKIVPGLTDFGRVPAGPHETLEFRQKVKGAKNPWKFYAKSMSDGTLRAVGALTAVMQLANRTKPVSLVGIEEPETALHPAATAALMDALREAAKQTQVIVTTHSPDLLDKLDTNADSLFVAEPRGGTTFVTPAGAVSMKAIKNHLFSPGELLRMDQLRPDESTIAEQERQMDLPFLHDEEDHS